jgi:hypothetical protein
MSIINDLLNPSPLSDCCDGGGFVGKASIIHKPLFLGDSCCKKYIENLMVEPGKTFAHGEIAKIVAGAITKLTAAPTAADQLVLINYAIDSTATAIADGKGQTHATVIAGCDGLNVDALVMPAGVVVNNEMRALLSSKGFNTTLLYTGA